MREKLPLWLVPGNMITIDIYVIGASQKNTEKFVVVFRSKFLKPIGIFRSKFFETNNI